VPREEAAALRIDVADTGIGIDPADQDKIGQEFFQANRHAGKAQEGTGLGIALSRRLTELMGGRFWFTSAPGQGSTFSFALPIQARIVEPHAGNTRPASSVIAVRAADRPLALIVEDYPATNKLLADWLDEAGLQTASAFDGVSGLNLAQSLKPQLILLDIGMPGLNGIEVLSRLKEDPATTNIPVVIISILEAEQRARELGIAEWLVKPLDRERLLQSLRRAVPSLLGASVLVVEDDLAFRNWLADLLEAEGFRPVCAANGREALEILTEQAPQVVLLDLLMPEMNGFELLKAIRSRPEWERLPIIIVTGKEISPADEASLAGTVQACSARTR
jgi:CheY-like chemotaxis protein